MSPAGVVDDARLLDACDAAAAAGPAPGAAVAALLAVAVGEDVGEWSLARRDAVLLELHAARFGAVLEALASCPGCGARVEASLPVEALSPSPPASLAADGFTFRLPTVRDALDAAALPSRDAARALLAARCAVSAGDGDAVAALGRALSEVETLVGLSCPDCDRAWEAPLDVGTFLLAAARGEAARVLAEVDALARAYGWTEADVLALPRARRRAYLALVGA